MKKLFLLLGLLVLFAQINTAQQQPAKVTNSNTNENNSYSNSNDISPSSMRPIMDDALPIIEYIEDSLDSEIVRIEYDLLFDGSSKTSVRTLFPSWKYGIFVIGDYRIQKINMRMYIKEDDDWKLVDQTDSDSQSALLMVEPTEKREYLFEIFADEFDEGFEGGHYCILVFH